MKEESESEDSAALAGNPRLDSLGEDEDAEEEPEYPPVQALPRPARMQNGSTTRKGKEPVHNQIARRTWSEGKRVYDEESDNASESESEDEEGDEYTLPPSKPQRTKAKRVEDDEDEDELMLGGEVRSTSFTDTLYSPWIIYLRYETRLIARRPMSIKRLKRLPQLAVPKLNQLPNK